ncbi:uncharacterized protein SCHCODRAFT_02027553 [Schizophyllum commune H4-8]|uniref:uncharacterized protein n=1 Tax=Schizophyllum commune (strain H4-8 / FGSC 9210) TaxID=578458 RepID=UPI002160B3DA|nr:uncharacterized protein SCHCODRAFT_02027553 [Schizophyllum commune H4-8]KAI5900072.1 hypothetical protein SCHCODRAFT_02027553 [Schizophyllum commune H4-8]
MVLLPTYTDIQNVQSPRDRSCNGHCGRYDIARLAQSDRASDSYKSRRASEGCEFDPRGGLYVFDGFFLLATVFLLCRPHPLGPTLP